MNMKLRYSLISLGTCAVVFFVAFLCITSYTFEAKDGLQTTGPGIKFDADFSAPDRALNSGIEGCKMMSAYYERGFPFVYARGHGGCSNDSEISGGGMQGNVLTALALALGVAALGRIFLQRKQKLVEK